MSGSDSHCAFDWFRCFLPDAFVFWWLPHVIVLGLGAARFPSSAVFPCLLCFFIDPSGIVYHYLASFFVRLPMYWLLT